MWTVCVNHIVKIMKLSPLPMPLSSKPVLSLSPCCFLGPECSLPPHSAPPSYHHHNHYHYPQNPPASPALLVHTECPRDCPLDDNMHPSVLNMPHHLGTAPQLLLIIYIIVLICHSLYMPCVFILTLTFFVYMWLDFMRVTFHSFSRLRHQI